MRGDSLHHQTKCKSVQLITTCFPTEILGNHRFVSEILNIEPVFISTKKLEKINVKFHKNCENTGKILKISRVRCPFVKFHIYFLGPP